MSFNFSSNEGAFLNFSSFPEEIFDQEEQQNNNQNQNQQEKENDLFIPNLGLSEGILPPENSVQDGDGFFLSLPNEDLIIPSPQEQQQQQFQEEPLLLPPQSPPPPQQFQEEPLPQPSPPQQQPQEEPQQQQEKEEKEKPIEYKISFSDAKLYYSDGSRPLPEFEMLETTPYNETKLFRGDFARFGDEFNTFQESTNRTYNFIESKRENMILSPRRGVYIPLPFFLDKLTSIFSPTMVIIDARFPEEYQQGHILGAQNVYEFWDSKSIRSHLYHITEKVVNVGYGEQTAVEFTPKYDNLTTPIIIYCDFSLYRAVEVYRAIINSMPYDERLRYKEMYILHTGFSGFLNHILKSSSFEQYSKFVYPQIDMVDKLLSDNSSLYKKLFLPELGQNSLWNNRINSKTNLPILFYPSISIPSYLSSSSTSTLDLPLSPSLLIPSQSSSFTSLLPPISSNTIPSFIPTPTTTTTTTNNLEEINTPFSSSSSSSSSTPTLSRKRSTFYGDDEDIFSIINSNNNNDSDDEDLLTQQEKYQRIKGIIIS